MLRKHPFASLSGAPRKAPISPIFQFWHGFCKVLGIPRNCPASQKIQTGDTIMNTVNFAQNAIAAVFALTTSIVLYAAAIVPASPSLIA